MNILIKNTIPKGNPNYVKKFFWYDDLLKKNHVLYGHKTSWKYEEKEYCFYNNRVYEIDDFIKQNNFYKIFLSKQSILEYLKQLSILKKIKRFVMSPIIFEYNDNQSEDKKINNFISEFERTINEYFWSKDGFIVNINEDESINLLNYLNENGFLFEVTY